MAADDAVGPVASAARNRLEAIRRALVAEMTSRLRRLDQRSGSLIADRDALDNARQLRRQVIELLREDGLPVVIGSAEAAVVDAIEVALGPQFSTASLLVPALGVSLDAEAKAQIADTVAGTLDEVTTLFGDAAGEVRAAMDVALNTGAPIDALIDEVAQKIDTTFTKAQAAVELAVRGAASKATIEKAERGADAAGVEMVYVYTGPEDGKNRPFCERTVGKAYTRAALRRLRNDDGDSAEVARGSFGCRHFWAPMLREDAEAEGIDVIER